MALDAKAWQEHFNRKGRERIWYALTHHLSQRDGRIAELSTIAHPFDSEGELKSFLEVIDLLRGSRLDPAAATRRRPSLHVIPAELIEVNPHEAISKLFVSQPGRENRSHTK